MLRRSFLTALGSLFGTAPAISWAAEVTPSPPWRPETTPAIEVNLWHLDEGSNELALQRDYLRPPVIQWCCFDHGPSHVEVRHVGTDRVLLHARSPTIVWVYVSGVVPCLSDEATA